MRNTQRIVFILSLIVMGVVLPQLSQAATQVSQNGITWTFDKDYTIGQFVNGDYWVLGPVKITSISATGGSMVNPMPQKQAYDDSLTGSFNVAYVNPVTVPLTLQANSSLVSTNLTTGNEAGASIVNGLRRPSIKDAAVLTVLASAPPANSFRPPYCGTAKPIYSASNLRKDLLPNLALPLNAPSPANIADGISRLWLDHFCGNGDGAQYFSPLNNMPNYGRDYSNLTSQASLLLISNISSANKDSLLIPFVQIGIDLKAVVDNGGTWQPNGGLNSGRKWPILFAGLMLDNTSMKNIGQVTSGPYGCAFHEDGQTFYVTADSPGGYTVADVGLPEWGQRHSYDPTGSHPDSKNWGDDSYRLCCNAFAWSGWVLAIHAMHAESLYNHDALFDYQDRYMKFETDWRSITPFAAQMWDTYRAQYGCIWTPNDPNDIYSNGHRINCSDSILYGDVSGDRQVSAYDAALTAQATVGLITLNSDQTKAADVSGDGQVSAYDAALIAQKSVGLIAKFPVEG